MLSPRFRIRRTAQLLLGGMGLAASTFAGVGVAAATSGSPAPSPIFGLRPALAGETTLDAGHFTYTLPAGGTVEDGIDVVNFTAGPLNIDMYRANLNPVKGGGLAPGQAGDALRGATAWLQLRQADVVLSPNGDFIDPFQLSIPPGTPPGQYLAALVGSRTGAPVGGGLILQSRIALEVEVTVVGKLNIGLTVGHIVASRTGGSEQFTVPVTNTGNTLVTLGGTINVSSPLGGAASVRLGPQQIYVIPGGTAHLTGTWSGLPFIGPAHLVASVTAFVNDAAKGTYRSPTLPLLFVPWLVVSLALGVLVALAGALGLTRKRRAAWHARRAEERRVIRQYRAGLRGA
jgi:hypothetical protein